MRCLPMDIIPSPNKQLLLNVETEDLYLKEKPGGAGESSRLGRGKKAFKLSKEASDIANYWNSKRLRQMQLPKDGGKATKTAKSLNLYIRSILKSQFFSKMYKYKKWSSVQITVDDIKGAIDTFEMIVNSFDYLPVDKSTVRSYSPVQFLYNKPINHSYLISCLEGKALVARKQFVHPNLKPCYEALVSSYKAYSPEFNMNGNMDHFIRGASMLQETMDFLSRRIVWFPHMGELDEQQWADWTIDALKEKIIAVSPWHLSNRITYDLTLYYYLQKRERLQSAKDKCPKEQDYWDQYEFSG